MTRDEAIAALRPGAAWSMQGDVVTWLDEVQTQPTEQEIADRMALAASAETAELSRKAAFGTDAGRVDLLNRLRTATPAQIDSWIDGNVTNLASARTVLKAIIKVIALDARNGA